jgi:uncharacterized iron-regulated membrane protein
MNWNKVWAWLTSFDVVKAIFLVVAVMVGSWYDLKAEVQQIGTSMTSHEKSDEKSFARQEMVDAAQDARNANAFASQDARMAEYNRQIQDALKDIKEEIRANRKR